VGLKLDHSLLVFLTFPPLNQTKEEEHMSQINRKHLEAIIKKSIGEARLTWDGLKIMPRAKKRKWVDRRHLIF